MERWFLQTLVLDSLPLLLLPMFNTFFWIFLIYISFLLTDLSHATTKIYMSSGWINSNTGLSRWRGPLIPTPFWVEWGVGGGGPWPVDKQPLRWPPTLAPSWQPLPQPGSSTLQWKKILLLSTARLGIPDRAFTRTPGEPDTRLNSLNF